MPRTERKPFLLQIDRIKTIYIKSNTLLPYRVNLHSMLNLAATSRMDTHELTMRCRATDWDTQLGNMDDRCVDSLGLSRAAVSAACSRAMQR